MYSLIITKSLFSNSMSKLLVVCNKVFWILSSSFKISFLIILIQTFSLKLVITSIFLIKSLLFKTLIISWVLFKFSSEISLNLFNKLSKLLELKKPFNSS